MATIVPFTRKVADIRIENHGSIVLLRPITKDADDWFAEVIPENAQWHGRALVVEPRYVAPIIEGAITVGLTIQ